MPKASQYDALLEARIEVLETQVEELKQALAERPAPVVKAVSNGRTLHPCDATSECRGHTEERHVDIHRKQVAKKRSKTAA